MNERTLHSKGMAIPVTQPASPGISYNQELTPLKLGNTNCFTLGEKIVSHLSSYSQIVRVVGGIPKKEVMQRAMSSVAPGLAASDDNTAFLIGCTDTFAPAGGSVSSVPNQGIKLQKILAETTSRSRVFGTLPGKADRFNGERLLLRSRSPSGYQTYMHPELEHGILFNGAHRNEWMNEAEGVVDLLEELVKNSPDLRYQALFIGGGEGTKAELIRTAELAKKFPDQIRILLA